MHGSGGSGVGGSTAIIYCHRREDVDSVAAALRRRGIACVAYHAYMPDGTRSAVLRDWRRAGWTWLWGWASIVPVGQVGGG